MIKEERKIVYDEELEIETITFNGIHQPFTKHFHDYYVIGIIRKGNRKLICNGTDYNIQKNNILLINPNDYHECVCLDEESLDYSAIHISQKIMNNLVNEIFKSKNIAIFSKNVICDDSLFKEINILSNLVISNTKTLEKEELFYMILKELLENYADFKTIDEDIMLKTKEVCEYIENNYTSNITLDKLAEVGAISKYHLIRLFTKEKGITPYKYLELYRINQAKRMLQQNISILDVSIQCGFSDQSHFTNLFKETIGITPKQYQIIFEERNSQNE